jgi:ribosomal subunit interface protein
MQQPTQIRLRNMRRSPGLAQVIQEHTQKLEAHHPEILHCRVAIEAESARARQGRRYRVSVNLRIRDHDIVANRHEDENVQVAIREAFDSVERQLREEVVGRREVRRRGVRRPS